jgi:antitoxin ParD1/3/4
MPTRNVVLTDHNEKMIESLVAGGRYQNASEVLRDGLRLVEEREAENAAKLAALRDAVRLGIESLERGEYEEFESVDALAAHLRDFTDEIIANP